MEAAVHELLVRHLTEMKTADPEAGMNSRNRKKRQDAH